MQRAMQMIFPAHCVGCDAPVYGSGGLCAQCWRETPFIAGLVCDRCGIPLPGDEGDECAFCDDCLAHPPPWDRGRAAFLYAERGRRIVLALKHGDRTDIAKPAARWMAAAARGILDPGMIVVPVPVHWTRLVRRRYNQAALLAREIARDTGLAIVPDALIRPRRTKVHDGLGRDERFSNMTGAIVARPGRETRLKGAGVLLVDDVMTSGATLSAAAGACHAAGATKVCVVTLARVAKST